MDTEKSVPQVVPAPLHEAPSESILPAAPEEVVAPLPVLGEVGELSEKAEVDLPPPLMWEFPVPMDIGGNREAQETSETDLIHSLFELDDSESVFEFVEKDGSNEEADESSPENLNLPPPLEREPVLEVPPFPAAPKVETVENLVVEDPPDEAAIHQRVPQFLDDHSHSEEWLVQSVSQRDADRALIALAEARAKVDKSQLMRPPVFNVPPDFLSDEGEAIETIEAIEEEPVTEIKGPFELELDVEPGIEPEIEIESEIEIEPEIEFEPEIEIESEIEVNSEIEFEPEIEIESEIEIEPEIEFEPEAAPSAPAIFEWESELLIPAQGGDESAIEPVFEPEPPFVFQPSGVFHERIAQYGDCAMRELMAREVAVCDRDGLLLYRSPAISGAGSLEAALLVAVSGKVTRLLGFDGATATQVADGKGGWRCLLAGAADDVFAGFALDDPLDYGEVETWTKALAEAVNPAHRSH